MRSYVAFIFAAALFFAPAPCASAYAPLTGGEEGGAVTAEQSIAAQEAVNVQLCLASGSVTVRGWERKEVRARSTDAARLELRRGDASAAEDTPAARVEVLVARSASEPLTPGGCNPGGSVELSVPRGSFVQLKGYSGDVSVADVAGVRVDNMSGVIELSRVAKSVEVTTANGDVTLANSSGRARVVTISGLIEARDLKPSEPGDDIYAKTTTGDITFVNVAHARVEARSINGEISLDGALARGGYYELRTHAGAVNLSLPADSTFQLSAKVQHGGEINTEFPIRQVSHGQSGAKAGAEAGGLLLSGGHLSGIAGGGEKGSATLIVSSFNGAVNLRKR